jgi:hypothetical protein
MHDDLPRLRPVSNLHRRSYLAGRHSSLVAVWRASAAKIAGPR